MRNNGSNLLLRKVTPMRRRILESFTTPALWMCNTRKNHLRKWQKNC